MGEYFWENILKILGKLVQNLQNNFIKFLSNFKCDIWEMEEYYWEILKTRWKFSENSDKIQK